MGFRQRLGGGPREVISEKRDFYGSPMLISRAEKRMPDRALTFGRCRLQPRRGLISGTREVKLTPKALALLSFLAERPGEVVTKDELFTAVWPESTVGDAALVTCIQEVRSALQDDARQPRYIETLHRRGYRFIGRALPASPAPSSGPTRSAAVRSPTADLPVGRELELQQLHRWFAAACEGERQIVFVTGEPG